MSRRKPKKSQDRCFILSSNCYTLKDALQDIDADGDKDIMRLKEMLDSKTNMSFNVNKAVSTFKNLIDKLFYNRISSQQCELILSLVICVLENKQLRQLAAKLILVIAENYNDEFNNTIVHKTFITTENIMFMILYCGDSIRYFKPVLLRSFWEGYFSKRYSDFDEHKFIFGCRAFNAYVVAIEKFHSKHDAENIVGEDTIQYLVKLASSQHLNRDCRQVIGLICLTLKTISTGSHHDSYTELLNQSYNKHLTDDPQLDLEFYRFILSNSMVTKIKEFKGNRDVLYEQVLDHSLNLAQRTDIDKLFTISVFKSVNLFLQSVMSEAQTEAQHFYPEQEDRPDPLSVDKAMLHPDSQSVRRVLALVQVHWSNKLEAVRRIVSEIHSNLIHLVTLLCGEDAATSFLNDQVKHVLSLSWSVHGKYQALSQLIPVIGTKAILQIESDLPDKLLHILSSDARMASYCASIYFTLYKHDSSSISGDVWLDPLTQHLDNPFLVDLCLRPILELDEDSFFFLRERLITQNRTEELVCVLREGRRLGLLDVKFEDDPEMFTDSQNKLFGIEMKQMKILCDSSDDNKVMGVLGLICETKKTALSMTLNELDLMTYIIQNNQIRQVPSFRKNLFDNLDKFLTRLNLSCPILAKLIKNRYTEDDELVSDKASEMLQLYSGFIRKCMNECYRQLIPSASFQRQVTVIGVLEKLYSILTHCKPECLEEITNQNLNKLFNAISSSFESVRSSSLSCVAAIQSIPTHCYTSTMKRVLRNLQSPKGILSMRNTALFSFVISKSLSKPGFTPRDVVLEDAFYAEHFLKDADEESSAHFQWISGLFSVLDLQIDRAEKSLMEASKDNPIFPAFNLLEVTLRYGNLKNDLSSSEKKIVIEHLLDYSTKLVKIFHEPIVDESPEGLLLMGSVESGGGSCGPQLLMSMTWRTIQSLCNCLVTMVTSGVTTTQDDTTVGLYLKDLLLSVRHHGVFENVHSAFISFCTSKWSRQKEVLLEWLEEVLCKVENCVDDMSYTRRSAGIPSVIQAILVTEPSRNSKPVLRSSMERLLRLAGNPAVLTARIHALNILYVLFKDSKLAEFVVPYTGPAFELSIRGFSEELWSLRNSSTMIFTVLMTRLFSNRQNRARQTTDATFFSMFANLHPYFLCEIARATSGGDGGEKCLYQPSLYPILMILQRLTPCPLSVDEPSLSLSTFRPLIQSFSLSGVYKTRSLAAEALSSIIPSPEIQEFVITQLSELQPTGMKHNEIHGVLLQVTHALQKCSDVSEVLQKLIDKYWLLTNSRCPYTAALYVSIVTDALDSGDISKHQDKFPKLTELVDKSLEIIKLGHRLGPLCTLKDACLGFILALKSVDLTTKLLQKGSQDVVEVVFETPDLHTWYTVEMDGLCDNTKLPLSGLLHLFKVGAVSEELQHSVYNNVLGELQSTGGSTRNQSSTRNQCLALEILSRMSNISTSALQTLVTLSSSLCPWELRLLLPDCLKNIFKRLSQHGNEDIEAKSLALFCMVTLLQDDDDEVRKNSANVILDIVNHPYKDIAPELVLPILLSFLLSQSLAWIPPLLDWIYQSDVQDLMTSHYSDQYKSEGYAAVSRNTTNKFLGQDGGVITSSDHITSFYEDQHPLFEPDLVNSYAEPLSVPFAVQRSVAAMGSGHTISANPDDLSCASNVVAEMSALIYQDYWQKCDGINFTDDENMPMRDFVFISKVGIMSDCFLKVSRIFGINLVEHWDLLANKIKI